VVVVATKVVVSGEKRKPLLNTITWRMDGDDT
jgi:hypothetical protein